MRASHGMCGDIANIITRTKFSVDRSFDTPSFPVLRTLSWSPLHQCKHYRATLCDVQCCVTCQDCLLHFSKEERMTGDSKWDCPRCHCKRDATKRLVIWRLPPILLVILKRSVKSASGYDDDDDDVSLLVTNANVKKRKRKKKTPQNESYTEVNN